MFSGDFELDPSCMNPLNLLAGIFREFVHNRDIDNGMREKRRALLAGFPGRRQSNCTIPVIPQWRQKLNCRSNALRGADVEAGGCRLLALAPVTIRR